MNFIYQTQRLWTPVKMGDSTTYKAVEEEIVTRIIPPESVPEICKAFEGDACYRFGLFYCITVNDICSCRFVEMKNGIMKLIDSEDDDIGYYDTNKDEWVEQEDFEKDT